MALTEPEKSLLLSLARASLEAAAKHRALPEPPAGLPEALSAVQGAFVTIHEHGRLRGCIGMIEGLLPLAETVIRMAAAASQRDPRFRPVSPAELPDLELELSVLSPLRRVASAAEIVLGRDGVLARRGDNSGVFLPQVATETGWDKERFLSELCAGKAGLEPDAWRRPECELYVFTVEIIHQAGKSGRG
jgi:uncharacterized protein